MAYDAAAHLDNIHSQHLHYLRPAEAEEVGSDTLHNQM